MKSVKEREQVRLLADCGTFRLGGPCARLVDCLTPEDLAAAVAEMDRAGENFVLIGGGSNLLFSDAGYAGAVLRFCGGGEDWRWVEPGLLEVSAAADLDALVGWSVEQGWESLVCCSGIPGTVGGAVVGNAGAWGMQLGDVVASVEVVERDGQMRWLGSDALEFSYRDSELKRNGAVVARARLRLKRGEAAALATRREELLALRREKHPNLERDPCIGSFFRNIEPTSAAERRQAAGWFLQQAGALEMRVGGARVYAKHANIIVRGEHGTAQDVLDLSRQMQMAVRERFGLELQREIRCLGSFEGEPLQAGFF